MPGVADTTAPTVGATSCSGTLATSTTCTATTNEASTCRVEMALNPPGTSFTLLSAGVASQSGVATVPITGLTEGTNYLARITCADAIKQSGVFRQRQPIVVTPSTSTAHLFVSPTGSGNFSCLDSANRCPVANVWSKITTSRRIIEAAPALYQGSSNMITPPSMNGTSTNPIVFRCQTDGTCIFDGQDSRYPLRLINNDWFILEGLELKSCGSNEVNFGSGADNNILRRTGIYDCALTNNDNTGNLFADIWRFGNARCGICMSQHGDNAIVRRAVSQYWNTSGTAGRTAFTQGYNSLGNLTENVIGLWDEEVSPNAGPHAVFRLGPRNTATVPASLFAEVIVTCAQW